MRVYIAAFCAISCLAACGGPGDGGGLEVIIPTPAMAPDGGVSGASGNSSGPSGSGSGSDLAPGAAGSAAPSARPSTHPAQGVNASSGLPCDVAELLHARCQACHTRPPAGGAPMAMLTYADLIAPAKSDPTQRVVDRALVRMQRGEMPPMANPPLSSAEIAVIADWIAAGVGRGDCGGADAGTTGGPTTPPAGDVDAAVATSAYDTPLMCTSGKIWSGEPSSTMHPGGECITCHSQHGGPSFSIGGTVYPSAHEPIDCCGVDGKQSTIEVIITDANGAQTTLQANSVGNFHSSKSIALPFHAKVVAGGRERAMGAAQMTGNCNHCHTESGANGAPGRIMAP